MVVRRASWRPLVLLVALLWGLLWAGPVMAGPLTVEARLEPAVIGVGEPASLEVTVRNASQGNIQVSVAPVDNLVILNQGHTQNISIINGVVSQSDLWLFLVTAQGPGHYTLPPVTVSVAGQTLRSGPLQLQVVGTAQGLRPGQGTASSKNQAPAPPQAPWGGPAGPWGAPGFPTPPGFPRTPGFPTLPGGGAGATRSSSTGSPPPATRPSFSPSPRPNVGHGPLHEPAPPGLEGRGPLFITATVDRSKVVVGQAVTFFFRFYRSLDGVSQPRYTAPDFTGFITEDLPPQRTYLTTIGGRNYAVSEIRTALFPSSPGHYSLGPAHLTCRLDGFPVSLDPDEDDLLRTLFAAGQEKELVSDKVSLEVLPLPLQGRPASFSGGVGQFKARLVADKSQLKVGEATNLRLEISGVGNVGLVDAPAWTPPSTVKLYAPVASTSIFKAHQVVQGTRTFTYSLVPTQAGTVVLPEVVVGYYDPRQQAYREVRTTALRLEVAPGAGSSSGTPIPDGTVSSAPAGSPAARPGESAGAEVPLVSPSLTQTLPPAPLDPRLFWSVQLIPLVLALSALWGRVRSHVRPAASLYRQRLTALRQARQRMATATPDTVSGILHALLEAWSQQALGHLTHAELGARWAALELPASCKAEFLVLLDEVEALRFAPAGTAGAQVESLLGRSRNVLARWPEPLRNTTQGEGSASPLGPGVRLGLLVLLTLALAVSRGGGAWASPLPSKASTNASASPTMPQSRAPGKDYLPKIETALQAARQGRPLEAAATLQACVDQGLDDAVCWYDLGCLYLKNQELARARYCLDRSRQGAPHDARFAPGYRLERERLEAAGLASEAPDQPWYEGLACQATPRVWCAGEALLWFLVLGLAVFVRNAGQQGMGGEEVPGGGRTWPGILGVGLVLAAVLCLLACQVRTRKDAEAARTAYVLPVTVSLYQEPRPDATVTGELRQASLVRVVEARWHWRRVETAVGSTGWLRSDELCGPGLERKCSLP